MNRRIPTRLPPLLSGLLFLLTCLALLPWPGLQNDELFFSGPIYSPDASYYRIDAGSVKIPLMVMSYTGALKTWLFAALFQVLPANRWTVRLPMLLLGIGTIWLTWLWARRIAGARAAAVAAILLGTDTIFLMTNTFDWGPVALQHVLLMGGLVPLEMWLGGRSKRWLALGFFLFGLGIWDKALMAWPLIGMAVAVVCVFPREAFRRVRFVPVAIALGSFFLGAAPLLWYNVARPGETATQNAKFDLSEVPSKLIALRQTIDASTLSKYMVYDDSVTGKRAPRGPGERLSVWIRRTAGSHRTNWMVPAWLLGFVFSLALWNSPVRRTLLFLLITMAVEWFQMAITKNTGLGSHHVILLWPFPCVWLGIVFSAMAERVPRRGGQALAIGVAFLAGENLLTTNDYLARFIVNGGAGGWTDAIYRLAGSLDARSASWFGLVDWGYLNGIRALHKGPLQLFIVDPNADRAEFGGQIGAPDFLFIQHTSDKQIFPGVNQRLRKAALELGYQERVERTVPDRNGRPVFELLRFQKSARIPAGPTAAR